MGLFDKIFGGKKETNEIHRKTHTNFQQQVDTFIGLGFTLNPGIKLSDIDRWKEGQKAFESKPYDLLYVTLGQIIEREPWTPLTNKCWNMDTEYIEDHGSYVDIMNNISRITNGELVFKNLEDYVDIDEGIAWVSFTCNGDYYKWDLKVDDDWVDGTLFDKVQELTHKYSTNGKFTYYDTGGQDFVLGYHSEGELNRIIEATGLKIVWLKAKGQIY